MDGYLSATHSLSESPSSPGISISDRIMSIFSFEIISLACAALEAVLIFSIPRVSKRTPFLIPLNTDNWSSIIKTVIIASGMPFVKVISK